MVSWCLRFVRTQNENVKSKVRSKVFSMSMEYKSAKIELNYRNEVQSLEHFPPLREFLANITSCVGFFVWFF